MASEQRLDVYTYADLKGAHLRVASRGKEWYARCINPRCGSKHDAFSVQPDGRTWGRWAGYGAWKCRKCWDSLEIITRRDGTRGKRGWGSIADLVMLCEGMTYSEAERFILEFEGKTVMPGQFSAPIPSMTDEAWCERSLKYLEQAQTITPTVQRLLGNYLASRGLTLETARRFGFGYSLDTVRLKDKTDRDIPFLVIPWYKDKAANTLYRKINRRNLHSPLPGDESKYKATWQSTNDALYLGECLLSSKRPTFLVESELDAATILQEAGDLVNVVATGTSQGGRNAVNEGRLRRQPFVFLSFDVDEAGEDASAYWKSKLDGEKCVRYRSLSHDVNELHTKGPITVRQWVEEGLARFVFDADQQESPISPRQHAILENLRRQHPFLSTLQQILHHRGMTLTSVDNQFMLAMRGYSDMVPIERVFSEKVVSLVHEYRTAIHVCLLMRPDSFS